MLRHCHALALSMLALTLATTPAGAKVPDYIAAAVADAARPEADKQRDANRKPAETLEFTGVKPGDQIAELLPGGGYFTRLFSKIVGTGGHIYALVPAPSANAPADMPDFAARVKAIAADPNYSNVSVVVEPFGQLKVPAPVDLVWTSQNYHDLHNLPGLDVGVFNQLVFDALKPGGSPEALITFLAKRANRRRVLVVGHEPDLGELAARLIGAGRNANVPFKKGGCCLIEFSIFPPKSPGRLVWWLPPRVARKLA